MSKLDTAIKNGSFTDYAGNEKSLNTAITSAIGYDKKAQNALHFVACACVQHAVNTGDTRFIKKLIVELGTRSQRRHRIAAWIRHHNVFEVDGKQKTFLSVNIDKENNVKVRICKENDRDQINVEEMYRQPYWDVVQVQNVKTNWELETAIVRFVKKAKDEGYAMDAVESELEKAWKAA